MLQQTNGNTNTEPVPADAAAKVKLTPDGLEAHLIIDPPQNGGNDISASTIKEALKSAKVIFGIDYMLIEKIKEKPQQYYSHELVIAHGTVPVNGKDGAIKYLFPTSNEPHPKVKEDGTVDYKDLGIVNNVKKGQLLCEITLPSEGKDGSTVTGGKLAASSGRPIGGVMGRNTLLNEKGTRLTSAIDGHVTLNGARVNVIDTFIVSQDVDNSTGNIKFVGNVTVNSNLLEGFVVEAAGNVEIGGNVQGGSIKAGGNVIIRGGVVGMSRSIIECKGNLTTMFFENCAASAGGNIKTQSIMNCNMKCGQSLEVTGMRAKIMGGRYMVGQNVTAQEIGSPANIKTELSLGCDPAVITRNNTLASDIQNMNSQIEKLNQIVVLLNKYAQEGQLPHSKLNLLHDSQISLADVTKKRDAAIEESKSLNELIQNSNKGKVTCRGIMYRGVKLTIGFASMTLQNDITSSAFTFDEGKIAVTPTSAY